MKISKVIDILHAKLRLEGNIELFIPWWEKSEFEHLYKKGQLTDEEWAKAVSLVQSYDTHLWTQLVDSLEDAIEKIKEGD